MLRESFGLDAEARRVEQAVALVWQQGWRTADVSEPGCRTIGTREMGTRITEAVASAGGVTV
jgi:3-isopropylmalate dehydrogenase